MELLDRSQFVTGSQKHRDPGYLPYAFTEHAVAMLSAVLRMIGPCRWPIRGCGPQKIIAQIEDRLIRRIWKRPCANISSPFSVYKTFHFGGGSSMPGPNRYIIPGYPYHLAHRCHNRKLLLKYRLDRIERCSRLRNAVQKHRISLLDFIIMAYA
jgi:hypothetical protein